MRKVTFGGANSLDNYIARKDDAVDWLMWGQGSGVYNGGLLEDDRYGRDGAQDF